MIGKQWPEYIVKDVCESVIDCVNKTAPVVDYETPYRMIRTSNVKNGVIDTENVRYVEKDVFEKWTRRAVPQVGDVVLTREAPLGDVGMLTKFGQNIFLGQRLMQYRADPEKLDGHFLLYALQESYMQGQLKAAGSGSTVEHVRVGDAENLKIRLPDLDTQKELSSILRTYDNLIENNNRRIAILEEMAQSLYREWFVKFRFPGHGQCQMVESPLGLIPEGWEVKTLKESIELAYGKALKKADRKDGEVAVYGSGGIGGFHNTALVNGPCIIVGRKGNVGSIFWCEHDCWPIDTVFYVKSAHSKYYLYFNLLHQTFHNSDAAVPGLNRESAYSNKLILPETEVVAKFDEIIDPMFSQLKNLRAKNKNLRKQRNLLLPKLISGQIDLSKIEQESA
ncbi:restriction endonuclease subunit S [Neptunomonas sp. XY-337]|uniref:restriction endonuclease subunit S n=1 Tax=Neptunomonas sp. XY-337 TaxID=2561897 RepID=UPI0010AB4193|nr:restriction endonuclease subunit S [Neptunomonas sp. XY-337]